MLEVVISWYLQIRDKLSHVLRISFDNSSNHLGLILKICDEFLKILNVYKAGSKWIVALPDQLELSYHVLKYFNAFFLVRVGETVQDNCNEQIEEDNADN